jgi:hypothetical protein
MFDSTSNGAPLRIRAICVGQLFHLEISFHEVQVADRVDFRIERSSSLFRSLIQFQGSLEIRSGKLIFLIGTRFASRNQRLNLGERFFSLPCSFKCVLRLGERALVVIIVPGDAALHDPCAQQPPLINRRFFNGV